MNDQNLEHLLKSTNKDLAIYLHFPWCVSKCPYCDFNSHTLKANSNLQTYKQALIEDILANHQSQYQQISSCFMGGGTPSLFPAKVIDDVLITLSNNYSFSPDIEITLEANPNSSDHEKFADYRSIGINRLSIGAQSFSESQLKTLGRAHCPQDIFAAVRAAKTAGFDNINIDLMHGLPGQSFSEAIADLKQAIALEPNHISWYQLTIEPNTKFAFQPPKLPDNDLRADIQDHGIQLLADHGYQRIEVSAFAQANKQCQHNLHVWAFNDYLGIGAGAHSKLSHNRQYRHYHPNQYIKNNNKVASSETINDNELLFQYMLNRARILAPLSREHILTTTKVDPKYLDAIFNQALQEQRAKKTDNGWQLTKFGLDHLDSLVSQCIME